MLTGVKEHPSGNVHLPGNSINPCTPFTVPLVSLLNASVLPYRTHSHSSLVNVRHPPSIESPQSYFTIFYP